MSIPQSTIPLQQSLDVSDVSSQTSSTGSCQSKGEVNVTPHKSEVINIQCFTYCYV